MFAAIAAVLALCVLALSACDDFYNRYSKGELDRLLATGGKAVKAWVDDNMPGGEIGDLRAHTYDILSGPSFLTDYVDYTVTYGGTEHSLMMNTVTGDVYESADMAGLREAVSRLLPEMLGIEEVVSIHAVWAELYVPYSAECADDKADIDGMHVSMLPYGTDDLDAFVTNVSGRPLIVVSIAGEGSEMGAVRELADVYALEDSRGLYVDFLNYGNADHYFDMYNDGSLNYYHKSWFEIGDFMVYVRDYELKQSGDRITGEVTTEEEYRFDPTRDIIVETTGDGYRFTRPDGVVLHGYCIGAPLGSPALSSDYRALILDEDGSSVYLTWDLDTFEYPTLVDTDGESFKTHYELDLVRTGSGE